MRGLNIRIRYAQATVQVLGADGGFELAEALSDVYALGRYDYHDGQNDPPAMFKGEPLFDAWCSGWDDQAEGEDAVARVEDSKDCADCSNAYGEACAIHR